MGYEMEEENEDAQKIREAFRIRQSPCNNCQAKSCSGCDISEQEALESLF